MPNPMRHMIILLPGIMGSALQKDGKDLWALSGQALLAHLASLGGKVDELRIEQDDWEVDDRGDGIHAARIIEDLISVPGLCEHAGYSVLSQGIKDFFDVTPGSLHDPLESANFFAFPYDWRRDNRVAARKLQRFVQQQLPRWRSWSGASDARVILIGHSMGGLIARYYLENLEGWKDCGAAITVGSPHRGAVKMVDVLSNGINLAKFGISVHLERLSSLVRTFPSVYQILPTYKAIEIDGQYVRAAETNAVPNMDQRLAKAGREQFLEAVRLKAIANSTEPGYRQRTIPWVGTRQDTHQSASLIDGKLVVSYEPPPGVPFEEASGDGTVPRVSAVPADLSGPDKDPLARFSVERHGWLTNNEMTLQPLLDTLQQLASPGSGEVYGSVPSETLPAAINLRFETLFLADEPATIQVKLDEGGEQPRGLTATVRPVGHQGLGAAQTVQVGGPQAHLVEFGGLLPGLYELTVAPETHWPHEPPPTHGAFEVVDPAALG